MVIYSFFPGFGVVCILYRDLFTLPGFWRGMYFVSCFVNSSRVLLGWVFYMVIYSFFPGFGGVGILYSDLFILRGFWRAGYFI